MSAPDLGTLRFLDLDFPVLEATLDGWFNAKDPAGALSWNLSVRCDERETSDEECWEPRLYYEGFALPVSDWKALSGQAVRWTPQSPRDADDGPRALYSGYHFDLPSSDIVIGARCGTRFEIAWDGTADLNFAGQDETPFSLRCTATFTGVTILDAPGLDERMLADRLARQLDLADLNRQPVRTMPVWRPPGIAGLLQRLFPGLARKPDTLGDFKPDED
jgi:hypothetical protein